MKHLIYIGDEQNHLADIFKEKLTKNGNKVEVYSTLSGLLPQLNKNLPDLILLNANVFAGTPPSEDIFEKTSTVIYAEQLGVEEKLDFYHKGAKRVIVGRIQLIPTVTSICSMILDRHTNVRRTRQQSLNYGILYGYSLQDILLNAFLEKKNLIIRVQNNGWDAKIRVYQGHIISAVAPDLRNEEAVLKTLHLPIGRFIIRRYYRREEHSSGICSTPAILAELKFEQKKMQEFFERVGSNNPEFRLSSFGDASLDHDEKILVELIKKHSVFQSIQLNSPFPVLKTVRILSSLFDRNLIYLEGESEAFETFHEKDIQYIEERLFTEEAEEGRIVILGVPSSGKSELIRKIAGQQKAKIQTIQYLDFTRIKLKENMSITLFGISIDEDFQPIFDKISEEMLAYIFLVAFDKKETFEYTKYLLKTMLQSYDVPCVLGLTNVDTDIDQAVLNNIRETLEIPAEIQLIPINPNSFKDVRKLIYNLQKRTQSMQGENRDA